jgi:prepilin-type processing-associated H-X9-DG protein/prepilin-type N-terminal cleavage/methylation domain-containing protein
MQATVRLNGRDVILVSTSRAFTLVELLVVVGVVAVLIALLMPALASAKRQAQRVACMSNLRQIGTAFIAYAQDSKGWFPAPASGFSPPHTEDWVYWQAGRDVTASRLYPYLGNSVDVLVCPLGPPERVPAAGRPPYPFNYSVNVLFTGDSAGTEFANPTTWGIPPTRLSQVVGASHKVLVIDEDVVGINDGTWNADSLELPDARLSSVSVRHDRGREYGDWRNDPAYQLRGRGNVAFADGHCEFIPRQFLQTAQYILPRYRP